MRKCETTCAVFYRENVMLQIRLVGKADAAWLAEMPLYILLQMFRQMYLHLSQVWLIRDPANVTDITELLEDDLFLLGCLLFCEG